MEDHFIDPSMRDNSITNPPEDEGELIQRYNEIVREYNFRWFFITLSEYHSYELSFTGTIQYNPLSHLIQCRVPIKYPH